MSVSITHGLLGLEAVWTFNSFDINDVSGGLPYARLDETTLSSGDFDGADVPAIGRPGEVPTRAQLRGRSLPFSGSLCAADLPGLRALVAQFIAAASDTAQTSMRVAPHPDWGTVALTIFGSPRAWSMVERQDDGPHSYPSAYQRGYVFTFRQRDPRAWALDDVETAGAANNTAATLTPGGLAPSEPYWVIAGPAGSVLDVQNVTTGKKLRFRDLPLLSGHNLIVDFGATTVRRSATIDGVDMTGYIDWSASNWWDPDTHGVDKAGASLKSTGAGAWTASAYPAVF